MERAEFCKLWKKTTTYPSPQYLVGQIQIQKHLYLFQQITNLIISKVEGSTISIDDNSK